MSIPRPVAWVLLALVVIPGTAYLEVTHARSTEEREAELYQLAATLIKDSDPRRRAEAAAQLADFPDKRCVAALVAALGDADPRVRATAADSLSGVFRAATRPVGEEYALKPLAIALKDSNARMRAKAAEALGYSDDHRAIDPLMDALRDPELIVRISAARGLGALGDVSAIVALREAAKDDNPAVRKAADDALTRIQRETQRLVSEDVTEPVAGDFDRGAYTRFSADLHHPDVTVQCHAVGGLGEMRDPRVVGPLVEYIRERDHMWRSMAITALGELGYAEAVKPLMLWAVRDPDAEIREVAVRALAEIGDRRALPAINTGLVDREPLVVEAAVDAVRQMHDEVTLELLAQLVEKQPSLKPGEQLDDTRARVRTDALRAIHALDHPQAVKILARAAVNESHRNPRWNAISLLGLYVNEPPDDSPESDRYHDSSGVAREVLKHIASHSPDRIDRRVAQGALNTAPGKNVAPDPYKLIGPR